ncbi:MAG: hypothetical protein ABFE07_25610 [Armatimonadia bacterium]
MSQPRHAGGTAGGLSRGGGGGTGDGLNLGGGSGDSGRPLGDSWKYAEAGLGRVTDIELQIQNLSGRASEIEGLVSKLEGRLEQVLQPSGPEGVPGAEMQQTVPLAARLSSIDASLFDSMRKLESILQRIEL